MNDMGIENIKKSLFCEKTGPFVGKGAIFRSIPNGKLRILGVLN